MAESIGSGSTRTMVSISDKPSSFKQSTVHFENVDLETIQLEIVIDHDSDDDCSDDGSDQLSQDALANENAVSGDEQMMLITQKPIQEFGISPYKLDSNRDLFVKKLKDEFDGSIEILFNKTMVQVIYHIENENNYNLQEFKAKVVEIISTVDQEVCMITETLPEDTNRLMASRRHMFYFLTMNRNIRGYCDEDGKLYFVFNREHFKTCDERIKIHMQIVKEQTLTEKAFDLTPNDNILMEAYSDELRRKPVDITVKDDKLHMVGFIEDINEAELLVSKIRMRSTRSFVLKKHFWPLSTHREVRSVIRNTVDKNRKREQNVWWHIKKGGEVNVAAQRDEIADSIMAVIQDMFCCLDVNSSKKMLESVKYERLKKYIDIQHPGKVIISVKKPNKIKVVTTKDVCESVKMKMLECEIIESTIPCSALQYELLHKMKDHFESLYQEEIERFDFDLTNEPAVHFRGVVTVREKVLEVLQTASTKQYFLVEDNMINELKKRMSDNKRGYYVLKVNDNKTEVILKKGRIENEQVDVIVSSSPSSLDLKDTSTGTIAGSIHEARGRDVIEFSESVRGTNHPEGTVKEGEQTGNLKCKQLFHVVVDEYCRRRSEDVLKQIITKCLKLATEKGYKSISFPAIGTGVMKYPKERSAEVILGTIVEFITGALNNKTPTTLSQVNIVFLDRSTLKYFEDEKTKRIQATQRDGTPHWSCKYYCDVISTNPDHLPSHQALNAPV